MQAAREASQLTDQLLSFERASGTDISRMGRKINLSALVQDVAERFQQLHPDAALDITYTAPGISTDDTTRTPLWISGDDVMLHEAILNLLTNALRHGGPALSRLQLSLTQQGDQAVLLVQDDGIGIPKDKQFAALSRFTQTNGGPGSGLGLPIAARVMGNHGGALEILDSAGSTTIRISLPLLDD